MLPAANRLRGEPDIQATLKTGRRLPTPHVRIFIRPNPHSQTSRFACVVGKRVSRSAVRRHRYQRWLRQVARRALTTTHTPPVDVVLLANPSITTVKNLSQLVDTIPVADI